MESKMQIIKKTILLFIAMGVVINAHGTIVTQTIPRISLSFLSVKDNGALLKKVNLSSKSTQALGESQLSLNGSSTLWDAGRGIYQSAVPGIGYSLCDSDGERCISHKTPWIPGNNLTLRIYKTGDVTGGQYLLPAFDIVGSSQSLLHINPQIITIKTSRCGISPRRILVKFPTIEVNKDRKNISNVKFKIPVKCNKKSDYSNIGIQFNYNGKLKDNYTLPTRLDNIGIQIVNEDGRSVGINTSPVYYNSFEFIAKLINISTPNQEYGVFSVDATILLTLR